MNTTAFFDPDDVNTPAGLAPVVAVADISGVPSQGTGLAGAAFVPGTRISDIDKAAEAATGVADATFVSTELAYGASKSDTTVAEFLGVDGASVQGNGDLEMGPSALTFSGYIYIPAGIHELSISSDDGFDLQIGGVDFSEFEGSRATDETARVAEFEGGLYEIDLLYFDQGGAMTLGLSIDGLPVDQSAFYQSVDDFQNPPADVATIPTEDYHPSYYIGETSLPGPVDGTPTEARDVITGAGSDDTIDGLGGDDEIYGGYGDDSLNGGDGDDVLHGGRGSDIMIGGAGDDILISDSDAGEQRIGQLAIGDPTRPDPDGEVDPITQKLAIYNDQPLHADDVMVGGEGNDVFLLKSQINAKLDIIQQHVRDDGSINWAGVAGENDELHDHWVDSAGINIIADYNAEEDKIAVIGHTAVPYVTYEDVNGDGIEESIITTISVQHGNGGAHDRDLIDQTIVFGDRVEVDDIETDDMVTYGIVDNYADVAEALFPNGDPKMTGDIKGYDTREPMQMMQGMGGGDHGGHGGPGTNVLGAVTGDPYSAFENPYWSEGLIGAPTPAENEMEPTREPFEQEGFVEVAGQDIDGTGASENLSPETTPEPGGLPGALGFWSLSGGVDGAYEDESASDAGTLKAYTLWENAALINDNAVTEGPGGPGSEALYFNGEDSFAYLQHDPGFNVSQGTIALWVRPDDLGEKSAIVTKDHSGQVDGGHFRLGHNNDGSIFLRFAQGDGDKNHEWKTNADILTEGEWQHIAVNFGMGGVTVYLDGQAIPDSAWTKVDGNVNKPGEFNEAYLINNDEPFVLGADQRTTQGNDTAGEFALDREDLENEFEGGIADFGIWGGYTMADQLNPTEINDLMNNGPGAALTNPAGPQPMEAGNDIIDGMGGNDTIDGGAGDDELNGNGGNDSILGGYGNDMIDGGAGNDTVDGGWGSDLVMGGDGDDVIRSRADVGEDRAGQLVLDDPSRPSKAIDEQYLKLFDWIDQPLVGDDVLVGGAGNDHFQIETLINGTDESIFDNVMDGTRMIHWHGVAGENQFVHDHWVDGIGIDVIADYNAAEDIISVIGHTTQVKVDYKTIDTDGDDIADDTVSVVTIYSQQGNGGGAHDEDYLGYLVVHGDRVEEDDIITDAGAHYGVVDTIDQLQTAFAPTGETKYTDFDGDGVAEHLGYDTRDVDGDPMGTSPWLYSDNYWLNNGMVDLASGVPEGLEKPVVLSSHDGAMFGGPVSPIEIENDGSMSAPEGTIAASFVAYSPGNDQNQAIFSQDHSGYKDGGHVTAFINGQGVLKLRFQSTEGEKYLYDWDVKIEAGEEYHMAFTFDADEIKLFLNGELIDSDEGYAAGMTGNDEDMVIGAATRTRQGEDDNLTWHFNGSVENFLYLDRPISETEAVFLSEADGDLDALNVLYGLDPEDSDDPAPLPPEEEPAEEEPAEEEPAEEEPAEEEPAEEEPAEEEPAEEEPAEEEPAEEEPAEEE
ncbi:MAG: LamG-like jellyroll fold domain-containing protein, partial [Pseudomonadota bacterium]